MLAAARQAVPFRKMSFPQPVKPVPFNRNEFFRKLYGVMGGRTSRSLAEPRKPSLSG
jgi:hypothetical protein